jgi:uncharacterized protein
MKQPIEVKTDRPAFSDHSAKSRGETGNSKAHFDSKKVLQHLKHYLPSQTPLKDFIHHNSLHAFQHLKFYDAIFKASKIFGYQVTLQLKEFRQLHKIGRIKDAVLEKIIGDSKGKDKVSEWKQNILSKDYETTNYPRIGALRAQWKCQSRIDMDTLVQPILFRVLCSYLDQGISIWKFPLEDGGFLASIRALEKNSFASFFKTARARQLLLDDTSSIESLLYLVVGNESYYEQYLFDQQFSHHGWSGMVCTLEDHPDAVLDPRPISLHDLIFFELLLEIDALDLYAGKGWKPLAIKANVKQSDILESIAPTELNDVLTIWQDAFEWSYYDQVLSGISVAGKKKNAAIIDRTFQALFCIDERECSLRRHVEQVDKQAETFGTPGFFGVEFYFQPENGKFFDKLCPAPVTPKYLVREFEVKQLHTHDLFYTKGTHSLFAGWVFSLTIGFLSAVRMFLNLFRPTMSPAISNAFAHMDKQSKLHIENKDPSDRVNGLQVGFSVTEMAARVQSVLSGIGLTKDFAPLIYVVAHGSSSANNPHHGAHDCGACSGRPGSVNSRVFAFMANHPEVRNVIAGKGIVIPDHVQFVGSLHDTAADRMAFYDDDILTPENKVNHGRNIANFEKALDLNAKERSRRFASINTRADLAGVRKAINNRSVSLFEPRPELGHGTNSLCIVGRRQMTKHLFLDRRAFLNSYDYRTDPEGKMLAGIMKPLGPVCGGINLEYYFSRVDNHKIGAGTKLPHNVMGLIGVANSSDGDLRPGLPLQMIEVHDPVRLLVIVEHHPDVVLKTIQSTPDMYEWFINEWVHLVALHPETGEFWYFKNGSFTEYRPLPQKIETLSDVIQLVESAVEMETNRIADATKENLPVYILNN